MSKLTRRAWRKDLTGTNLAAIKKELKLVWRWLFNLRESLNQQGSIIARPKKKNNDQTRS